VLYPSIDRLMEKIESKYAIVILASKRARQLLEDYEPLLRPSSKKCVGVALEEIAEGLIENTLLQRR